MTGEEIKTKAHGLCWRGAQGLGMEVCSSSAGHMHIWTCEHSHTFKKSKSIMTMREGKITQKKTHH